MGVSAASILPAQPSSTILVVDDALEHLRLLSKVLGDDGFEVRPVTDGALAIEAAENCAPDLVLLDIGLAGIDGFEVCRRFRDTPGLRDVPVIFLTAVSDPAGKMRAFDAGGVDYITKPFHVDELLARVRTHVELHRARIELAESLEKLKSLEALRDDLVHMIVHDMRSPLTALLGHLRLIEMAVDEREPWENGANQSLLSAIRSGLALQQMANDLLDVRRMEEGKVRLNRARFDLLELAEGVAGSLRRVHPKRLLRVQPGPAVVVLADRDLVHRVIDNLLSNAIKHTPSNSAVDVVAIVTGARVRLEVRDRGSGIPLEARSRIFEKFGNLSRGRPRSIHSAGLGLAFCKMAVEAHGGTIGVDCPASGGSVFWIELGA
jgi:two-component system sensor histidine kinase/response regulator